MWLVPKSTSIDYFTQLFLIAADWGTIPHVISSHFSPYMKLATTNHIVFVMKICLRILEWLKKLKPFGRNCCNKYWGTYSLYEIQIKKIHTLITLLYPFFCKLWAPYEHISELSYLPSISPISYVKLLVLSADFAYVSALTWLMMLICISLTYCWKTICSQMFSDLSLHEILLFKLLKRRES